MRKLYALMLSLQILLASAIGLSSELAAQERPTDTNIIGHVTDAKTGEHLAGVTIAIKGTTFGTATDLRYGYRCHRALLPQEPQAEERDTRHARSRLSQPRAHRGDHPW